jgi:hypothetical protein
MRKLTKGEVKMRRIFPKENDTRLIKKFLFTPKTIDDEMRWLEVATWEEMYQRICTGDKSYYCIWLPTRWANY